MGILKWSLALGGCLMAVGIIGVRNEAMRLATATSASPAIAEASGRPSATGPSHNQNVVSYPFTNPIDIEIEAYQKRRMDEWKALPDDGPEVSRHLSETLRTADRMCVAAKREIGACMPLFGRDADPKMVAEQLAHCRDKLGRGKLKGFLPGYCERQFRRADYVLPAPRT